MRERDYRHRDVLDKLGIKPGHAVVFVSPIEQVQGELCHRILDRVGRPPAETGEPADVILAVVDDRSDPVALLQALKPRLVPNGGIWLLSLKRGQPGYVNQTDLIAAGLAAGLVDNKICSVSDTTSAMRFVIRRSDRI